MRVLITGGTGFIANPLKSLLEVTGHEVLIASRKPGRDVHWDPMSGPPRLPPLDAVIHLAGEPVAQRWNADVKRRIRESRVIGTRNLVDALRGSSVKTLISSSATGYYGDRADEALTEESAPGRGFLPEVCLAWEHEAARAREFGIRVVPIRTGIVLGRDGGALDKMLPPFRFGIGGNLGSGEQWMSWIHLDDLAGLFRFALENEALVAAVNGTAPNPVRNGEFTQALGTALKRPTVLTVPGFALHLLYGEMAQVLLEGQRVLPAAAERAGYRYKFPHLTDALEDLLRVASAR